jgi:hypothetical protein
MTTVKFIYLKNYYATPKYDPLKPKTYHQLKHPLWRKFWYDYRKEADRISKRMNEAFIKVNDYQRDLRIYRRRGLDEDSPEIMGTLTHIAHYNNLMMDWHDLSVQLGQRYNTMMQKFGNAPHFY